MQLVRCENGGELHGSSCVCMINYTGVGCETEVSRQLNWPIVAHLLNGTFNLDECLTQASVLGNSSLSVKEYDVLVDRLVEGIWSELSAEQSYLHSFNYSSLLNQSGHIGRRLHQLKLVTQQDLLNFELNFKLFVKAVDKLVDNLNSSDVVRSEAVVFTQEWIRENNLTAANRTRQNLTASDASFKSLCRSVMSRLKDGLNVTREVVDEFYQLYMNRTEGFNESIEHFVKVLSEMTNKTWDSLVNFGFWRVTRQLSGIEHFGEIGVQVLAKRSVKDSDDESSAILRVNIFKYNHK